MVSSFREARISADVLIMRNAKSIRVEWSSLAYGPVVPEKHNSSRSITPRAIISFFQNPPGLKDSPSLLHVSCYLPVHIRTWSIVYQLPQTRSKIEPPLLRFFTSLPTPHYFFPLLFFLTTVFLSRPCSNYMNLTSEKNIIIFIHSSSLKLKKHWNYNFLSKQLYNSN